MDFIKQNKLLSGAAVLGILVLGYYFMFAGSGDTAAPLTETGAEGDSPVTQELLVTLSNLRSIELNGAIFTDPVFVSLTDFGVAIPQEPVGRRNPFLPFTGGTQSSTVKPLNAY